MKRIVLVLAALALLAPALASALEGCVMAECPSMRASADPHACCPTQGPRLVAACCDHGEAAPAESATPAAGTDRRSGAPPEADAVPTPAVTVADPGQPFAAAPEPEARPPRDLLSRHCILRI